ncbi:hypothetical protein HY407_01740 [Candidatus Gottesmanbacteria bacterium]|nr:hypothetical protein [Candidatus Gottesmanbacteria bacterium]
MPPTVPQFPISPAPKKTYLPFILLIALFAVLVLVVSNIGKVQLLQKEASGGIDTLDYLVSDHAAGVDPNPKSLDGTHNLSQTVSGQSLFSAKFNDPDSFEYYTWDDNFIYLKEDSSIGVGNTPPGFEEARSYKFFPGIWMKRKMAVGKAIKVDPNNLTFYDSSCKKIKGWNHPYTMTLETHYPSLDIGGDLGKQDIIVLKYDYANAFEKFYYSRKWGYVKWEEWDSKNGSIKRSATFNRIKNTITTPQPKCTPPPAPTSSKLSPSPSMSPSPSPSPSSAQDGRLTISANCGQQCTEFKIFIQGPTASGKTFSEVIPANNLTSWANRASTPGSYIIKLVSGDLQTALDTETITLASGKTLTVSLTGSMGQTHLDCSTPTGNTQESKLNNNDPSISYSGPWSSQSGGGGSSVAYLNDFHYAPGPLSVNTVTKNLGAKTSLTFTGSQIEVGFLGWVNRGYAEVYIDNVKADSINTSTGQIQHVKWKSSELPCGQHTLLITQSNKAGQTGGRLIALDYIVLRIKH